MCTLSCRMVSCVHCKREMHQICVLYFEPLCQEGLVIYHLVFNDVIVFCIKIWCEKLSYSIFRFHCHICTKKLGLPKRENKFSAKRKFYYERICTSWISNDFSIGLPTTRLGTFLEDRVNTFLRNNGVTTGEVTIRMVLNTDKVLETRSGMKNRSVM